ncbi:hypothetical protein ACFL3Z_02905 [Gemmatimonadota bacterium]
MVYPRRIMVIAMAALAFMASGCRTQDQGRFGSRRLDRPIPLRVENNNFLDVTIYAVGDGPGVKLGEVTGKSTGSFSIDPRRVAMVGGLRIRVEPLGSIRNYLSPTVFLDNRASLYLEVAALLEMSWVAVR